MRSVLYRNHYPILASRELLSFCHKVLANLGRQKSNALWYLTLLYINSPISCLSPFIISDLSNFWLCYRTPLGIHSLIKLFFHTFSLDFQLWKASSHILIHKEKLQKTTSRKPSYVLYWLKLQEQHTQESHKEWKFNLLFLLQNQNQPTSNIHPFQLIYFPVSNLCKQFYACEDIQRRVLFGRNKK